VTAHRAVLVILRVVEVYVRCFWHWFAVAFGSGVVELGVGLVFPLALAFPRSCLG